MAKTMSVRIILTEICKAIYSISCFVVEYFEMEKCYSMNKCTVSNILRRLRNSFFKIEKKSEPKCKLSKTDMRLFQRLGLEARFDPFLHDCKMIKLYKNSAHQCSNCSFSRQEIEFAKLRGDSKTIFIEEKHCYIHTVGAYT